MLRLRFSSGLLLGLILGVPVGVLVGMLILPPRPTNEPTAASLQMLELTRQLDAARDAKERADRQIEQFQKLAEQMTTSFNTLEVRFKALEEAQRAREAQLRAQPTPVPPVPTPTATPPPSPAATTAPAAPPPPEGGAAAPPAPAPAPVQ